MHKKIFFYLFIFFTSSTIYPQFKLIVDGNLDYNVRNWKVEHGLPQNSINKIIKSPDGFLWLATNDGLVRFDGVDFKIFKSSNLPGLTTNRITTICADKENGLWIGTEGGGLFYFHKGQLRNFYEEGLYENQYVTQIINDSKNRTFITTPAADVYLIENFNFKKMLLGENDSRLRASNLYEDSESNVWLINARGLYLWKDEIDFVKVLDLDMTASPSLIEEKRGVLWASSVYGIHIINTKNIEKPFIIKHIPISYVSTLSKDLKGRVWASVFDYGLLIFDNEKVFSFTDKQGLSYNRSYTIFHDEENNTWVGTQAGGLNLLTEKRINTFSKADGINTEVILPVFQDSRGRIWVGTNCGGVYYSDGGKFIHLDDDKEFKDRCIWSIAEDSEGRIWFGTYNQGIYIFENGKTTISTILTDLPSKVAFSIFKDSKDRMWIGTFEGVLVIDGDNRTLYNKENGLLSNHITQIYEDSKNNFWVATNGGGVAKLINNKFETISTENGLSHNHVRAIHEDEDGVFWFGTYGGGLNRYENGELITYSAESGLYDDVVSAIYEDENNVFWMSSNRGIYSVRRRDLNDYAKGNIEYIMSIAFGKSDGMLDSECNGGFQPSFWRTNKGKILFPTIKGVAVVDPKDFLPNRIAPPVNIHEFKSNNITLNIYEPNLVLSSGRQSLQFQYTALSFVSSDKIQFKYKLKGYEEHWNDVGNRRSAYYTNLGPGKYEFQVIACNSDGIWNTTGASIKFKILPEFYETTSFYIVSFIAFIFLIYGTYKWRVKRLTKRKEVLENLVEERTAKLQLEKQRVEAASNELEKANIALNEASQLKTDLLNIAAHDLKTPLGAIIGYSDFVKNEIEKESEVSEFIENIHHAAKSMLELIEDLLKSSSIESGKVEFNFVPTDINIICASVTNLMEHIAEKKNQMIFLNKSENKLIIKTDRERLSEIIINLVSNAIKYSPFDKNIYLNVFKHNSFARIEIKDEGPGLSEKDKSLLFQKFQKLSARPTDNESSTGLGLAIVKQLTELMGGKVWAESELNKGTSFFLEFPIEE